MKKLFVIALAAVGMVACVNDEIVETPQGNAISFDNAFIDNATRAELTAANLEEFKVWGYIDADGTHVSLFEGDEVSKATGDWAYEGGARYWAPGMQHYFQAIAPLTTAVEAEHADGEVSAINYTVDGDSDLIYAAYNKVGADAGETNGPVSFTFGHLLSKVEFEFVNGFAADDDIEIAVKNVKMTVPAKGKYDIATGEWSVDTTVAGKTLENIEGSKFVLPYDNSYAYAIEFDVDVTYGSVLINEDVHKTSSVMVALNKGTAYKFTATINAETLNMESIDFEVGQVDGWVVGGNSTLGTAYVSTADAFQAALNNPGVDTIVLTDDINLNDATTRSVTDPELTIVAGKTVTIDLNGKTLSSTSSSTGKNYNMFDVRGNLTVKNGTMEYKHNGTNMGWSNSTNLFNVTAGGVLNLNGVTAKNLGDSDMAFVAHLNNWGEVTLNVDNSTLESTYIPVRVFNSGNDMNNVTIKNTTLKGKYCFWVHNYTLADFGTQEKVDAHKALLNFDIFNTTDGESNNNTFTYANNYDAPVLYGFTDAVYFDQYGEEISFLTPIDGVEGVALDSEGNYVITADEGLASISALIAADEDGFAGKTILLNADVDLANVKTNGNSFAPIGSTGERDDRNRLVCEPFKGTFDGQGNTIENLYQSGWDMGYEWGQYGSLGLFAELENATVKNVVIKNHEAQVEGGDISFIAGSATGECVFENIVIESGKIGTYNNGNGAIIGWSGAGTYTFKNIVLGEDVVLGGLWGSFDSSIGGIVGQAEPGATYNFENVEINCRIDAYNDCTASYDYYNYRMCGMIIGRCEATTTIDGINYPDLSQYNMTFNNVVVNYGTWMNYHYCEPTPGLNGGRGMRIEPGYAYDGLPADFDHTQCVDNHYNCIPFDQLIGGDQIAVKGLREVAGVTVNYPAEYTCPLCGEQHNVQ